MAVVQAPLGLPLFLGTVAKRTPSNADDDVSAAKSDVFSMSSI